MLLPGSRALRDRQAERVVVVDHGGDHRADVVGSHVRPKTQEERHPPLAAITDPETSDAARKRFLALGGEIAAGKNRW